MKKGQRYPAEVLSRREVEALLGACGNSRTGRRDRAILAVLWRGGLRISEALSLERRDVDFERGTVRIRCGKGAKSRTVGLDGLAASAIGAWLAVRPAGGSRVFCALSDPLRPVNAEHVRNKLKRLAARAGLERRVHPHMLRHTFACELVEEGADVVIVRDLLGHSSLSVTDAYVRGLGASRAVEFARRRTIA